MLLTLGSPLDKIAFIYRTQTPSPLDVREAAAATVQPLLRDYALRPRRWVNLFSRNDVISGSLQYYDDPQAAAFDAKGVINIPDPEASTPLAAHGEYWSGRTIKQVLRVALES